MSLRQKRIVVIGGTSGIGLGVAQAAREDGASVIVGSSSAEKMKNAVAKLADATVLGIDVRNEESVASFFEKAGAFDHLVYTAGDWGGFRAANLPDLDFAQASGIFDVRFWGALKAVKHAHKNLREGGSITLTDGMIAQRPSKTSFLRTAMAGSVEHLTRGLAVELAPIRVNCVCPGVVRTEIWNTAPTEQREERIQQMTKHLLVKRGAEVREVVEAYLYLMRGGYTTGQVLYVDGGGSVL